MVASFRVGRLFGVDIGVHWSWIFIFLIITWSFATGVLDYYFPDWTAAQRWVGAVAVSAVFFLSVLIHEMSHAIVSNRLGLPVRSITLFIFGGAANLSKEPEHAGDEFKIAIVGPLTSAALAAIFGVAALAIWPFSQGVAGITLYMAIINGALAVFNMLPGFPLDGGRVFRSAVWSRNRDRLRATRTAAQVGQWIAYGIMGIGIFFFLTDVLISGIWFLLIGFFLRNAASASYEQLLIRTTLSGIRVDEVMRTEIPRIDPTMTLDELVNEHVLRSHFRAFPVVAAGRLAGLVTLTDVRKVPRDEWSRTSVYKAMTPAERLHTIEAGQCLTDVIELMAEHDVNQLPVLRGGELVGMLDRGDVMRFIQVRRDLSEELESDARRIEREATRGAA